MEKTWDEFWATGKVTDYLAYRNVAAECGQRQKKETGGRDGTGGYRDGHGFDCHACR